MNDMSSPSVIKSLAIAGNFLTKSLGSTLYTFLSILNKFKSSFL